MKSALSAPLVRDAAICVVLIAVLLALPFLASKGAVFVVGTMALHIVFGLSWNLMFGQTGLVSFGHASFFALGGYFYAVIARGFPELHPLLGFAGAGLFGVVVALAVGAIALRRSQGVYFAILTLALSQIVYLLLSSIPSLGREDGFTGIRRPVLNLGIVEIDLARGDNYYFFIVLFSGLLSAVIWWVRHSQTGRALRSIQQDPERAAFLGINAQANRLAAFAIASGVTAIAGALYGPWLQLLTPDVAHWTLSARPILYSLLGGVQSFWGPVIGAAGFALLEYGTRTLHGFSEIIIGTILLVVVLVFPGGILGGAASIARRLGWLPTARKADTK
jgi:branched-chain amino acid transport system permease protein